VGFHSQLTKPPTHPLRPVIPSNARSPRITAAAGTELAGAYSQGTVSLFPCKRVYTPKGFFLHAALLGQAFAHCPIFPTAASRRSLDRVSVPVWLIILSDQLRVIGLVGLYPTNYLIRRSPIPQRP